MGVSKVLASPLWVWMWFGGHLARAETRHLPVIMQQTQLGHYGAPGYSLRSRASGPDKKLYNFNCS